MQNKGSLAAAAALSTIILTAIAAPTLLHAGDVEAKEDVKQLTPAEMLSSPFSGDIGITYTSAYAGPGARGFTLQNRGWILQPYLDLNYRLYQGDGFINSLSLTLGQWSSVHERTTNATNAGGLAHWNEYDFYPGIKATFAKNFTLAVTYFEITSPAGAFHDAHPLYVTLSYDDTDLLGRFALHPTFQYQYELPATGSTGLEKNANYFNFSIAPSIPIVKTGPLPTKLVFPMSVGLGDHRFYDGPIYGYFAAGMDIRTDLKFIPKSYGAWDFRIGATYWNAGPTVAEHNGRANDWLWSSTINLNF